MASLLGNTRRPDISFYKNGRIDIASRVVRMLDIQEGDVIDIDQCNGEYLLYVRLKGSKLQGRHQAQCYPTKNNSHNYRTYSKRLSDAMLSICGAEQIARLSIGEALNSDIHGKVIPIITRINLNSL